VASLAFALGTGTNSLTLDHVTLALAGDGAISAGTNVTIDGGVLNFNGHPSAIGDLTLSNDGEVVAATIENTTTTVTSGTLTADSIVCDTLVIGSFEDAAAGASSAGAADGAATRIARLPEAVAVDPPVSIAADNAAMTSTASDDPADAEQGIIIRINSAGARAISTVSVASASEILPITSAALPVAGDAFFAAEMASAIELPRPLFDAGLFLAQRTDNRSAHLLVNPFSITNRLRDAVYGDLTDASARASKRSFAASSLGQSTHRLALQSILREFQYDFAAEEEDADLFLGGQCHERDELAKQAVDDFHLRLVGSV
jgi:hypothetical protein